MKALGRPHARGFSLIDTLVGLALALLALVAMSAAYRSVVLGSQTLSVRSQSLDQASGSTLSAQQLIQQAGWGMGPAATPTGGAANTDIVLLTSAAVTNGAMSGTAVAIAAAAQSGNALVWDQALSGVTQCRALLISNGGLQHYGPVNCANAAAWSSLAWGGAQALAQSQALSGTAQFQAQVTSCWPFGGGPAGPQTVTQVTLSGFEASALTLCLLNITH